MERRDSLLLVEDEEILRGLVAQFLRGVGFCVVEARDGPEGVARFLDSGPVDLALVDLNLPGFSGVEVCRRLRGTRPDQPIIICSAAILPEHEAGLRALGVAHFLTKPYHPEVLVAHIAEELGPMTGRRPGRRPAAARPA
ncbi:MAG TPA: response regulator [Isosphaeraceae bacterium]